MTVECNLFGTFITCKFSDIWPDYDTFKSDYDELPTLMKKRTTTDEDSLKLLYYLYSARFMNSTIANTDINQFKAMWFNKMYIYTSTYLKREEIRSKLLSLEDVDITTGTTTIYNHAYNPAQGITNTDGSISGMASTAELGYINEQNTTNYKRNKIEAYGQYLATISSDPTEIYLSEFNPLFITVVEPYNELMYESGSDSSDN